MDGDVCRRCDGKGFRLGSIFDLPRGGKTGGCSPAMLTAWLRCLDCGGLGALAGAREAAAPLPCYAGWSAGQPEQEIQ